MAEKFLYDVFLQKWEADRQEALAYKQNLLPDAYYSYQRIGAGSTREKTLAMLRRERIEACRLEGCHEKQIALYGVPDHFSLWEHNADKHRGICLEYAVRENQKDLIYPIEYRAGRPKYTKWESMSKDQVQFCRQIEQLALIRNRMQKDEKEYRIVMGEPMQQASRNRVVYNAAWLNLKLSRIFLGIEISNKDREVLLQIVHEINERRIKEAMKSLHRDQAYAFCTLYCMEQLVTVWDMYLDDKNRLKSRRIPIEIKL